MVDTARKLAAMIVPGGQLQAASSLFRYCGQVNCFGQQVKNKNK